MHPGTDWATTASIARHSQISEARKGPSSVKQYVRLTRSTDWTTQQGRCEDADKELKSKGDETIASEVVARWLSCYPDVLLHGGGWVNKITEVLPKFADGDTRPGQYIDVLSLAWIDVQQAHFEAYGEVICDEECFWAQIQQYRRPAYRAKHPLLHYRVIEMPGTISTFY